MEYSLKIFGTGYLLKRAKFTNEQLALIAHLMSTNNISLYEVLFDFEYLEQLGFSSWDEIPSEPAQSIVQINNQNKIEITLKAKRLLQQKTNSLISSELLFPLFQISKSNFSAPTTSSQIVFGEVISGQIVHCRFTAKSFNAFNLKFDLLEDPCVNDSLCFAHIYYENKKLISTSTQFLSRSFVAFYL